VTIVGCHNKSVRHVLRFDPTCGLHHQERENVLQETIFTGMVSHRIHTDVMMGSLRVDAMRV